MAAPVSPDDLASWSRALGFSVEGLALNRKGLVAPGQLEGLWGDVFRSATLCAVLVGCAVAIACLVKPWWRWLAVVAVLCLAVLFTVRGVRSYLDRTRPQVVSVEGKALFSGGYRHSVIATVGEKTFTFPERTNGLDTAGLFPADRHFRFYWLRYTGKQLSVEPIRP